MFQDSDIIDSAPAKWGCTTYSLNKEAKMVSSFALDLFKDPFFIGFNRELDRIHNIHNVATRQSYPPYDLLKLDEDTYKLSLAIAGFSKDNINV